MRPDKWTSTPMVQALSSNIEQIEYWNSRAGQTWVRFQEALDRQIEPLGLAAIDVLQPRQGESIVDIGCGCGQSSLELARRVGRDGSVVGIDISRPMLDVAVRRPRPSLGLSVTFNLLDAQTDDLGIGAFDAGFSRFGVMFFRDPVAAFANIRKSLKSGGRFAFVCWQILDKNPWMLAPLQLASPFLPTVAPPEPTAPGPFAFADANRVRAVLTAAGFQSVRVMPFETDIGGSDVEQTLQLVLSMGPLGAALREHPELGEMVRDPVRDLLSKHLTPNGVLMGAAVWLVLANNEDL